MGRNQRSLLRYLIHPRAQFGFFCRLAALPFVLLFTLGFWYSLSFIAVAGDVEHLALGSPALGLAMSKLNSIANGTVAWVTVGLVVLVLHFILLSHRIFGPMVSIRRYVDTLAEGADPGTLRLRAEDEFHDLADSLNALRDRLHGQLAEIYEAATTDVPAPTRDTRANVEA